jgi:hypothetical protein
MPLIVNTKHAHGRSIQDIYLEMANDSADNTTKERCAGMLKLIEFLNETFPNTQIWVLTSIRRLVLQTDNNWKSDWFLIIGCLGNEYRIEYLLPEPKKPWPYAYVLGDANGLETAKKYTLIAMKECGAWEDNIELLNALRKI